jgi:hypothetical protein
MYKLLLTVLASLVLASTPCPRTHALEPPAEDVKAHGAVGDGRADDTKAFQDSLAAAKAARAGIYVPAGHYRITQPLSGYSDFTLEGDGASSEIIYEREQAADDKGWDHSLFNFHDGDKNIRFGQLRLTYKGTFSVGGPRQSYLGMIAGIYLPMVHDVLIDRLDVSGFNSYGIHQTTASTSKYATNVEVRKCRLHDNRVSGFRFDYVDGCRILDCDLYHNGLAADSGTGYGLAGSSGGRPKNILVKGCRAYDNKRVGIDFHVGDNVTVEDNVVTGSPNNGIGDQGGIYIGETYGTCKIVHNKLRTFRDRGETRAYLVYAIRIGYPYKDTRKNPEKVSVVISDNTIEDFDVWGGQQIGYPIMIDNTFDDAVFTIENNDIDAMACHGILAVNDHPGNVKSVTFNVANNRLSTQKLGYLPVRITNVTDVRLNNNRISVGSSPQPGAAVFVIIPGGPGISVYCSGNTAMIPPDWNRKALLAGVRGHSGVGNTINGMDAD